ncbi:hypothetical protein V8C35DRAFT_310009 [Trichoderma chlorosporum]
MSIISRSAPIRTPNGPQSGSDQPVAPSPKTGTVGKLTVSTELMQNYILGEVISPKDKFEALQSSDGHSLLFAIDSSGIFHVIEEKSGTSQTGWQVYDLSIAIIKPQFSNRESEVVVRTIDVGQSVSDGSIGLMMAVTLDGTDHLFISLGNSSSNTSWVSNPNWKMIPFDPEGEPPNNITIAAQCLLRVKVKSNTWLLTSTEGPKTIHTLPVITLTLPG